MTNVAIFSLHWNTVESLTNHHWVTDDRWATAQLQITPRWMNVQCPINHCWVTVYSGESYNWVNVTDKSSSSDRWVSYEAPVIRRLQISNGWITVESPISLWLIIVEFWNEGVDWLHRGALLAPWRCSQSAPSFQNSH